MFRETIAGAANTRLASVITYTRMSTPDPLDPAVIGARVKALREASGLSLRDLAERSGVSAPMLSQVERGETSPTLTVAARIAAGLELRLSQLLRLDEDGAVTVVRAGQRQRGGNKQARAQLRGAHLLPARPARRALAPHARARRRNRRGRRSADARARQPRDRARRARARSCSCATGSATCWTEGDCVTFDADLPHHFENPRERDAEAAFLAVVSAGLRRS